MKGIHIIVNWRTFLGSVVLMSLSAAAIQGKISVAKDLKVYNLEE